ncbi:dTMP kinase [Buchnera aphidicola (Kurisakia onigurumii)]|uniref:dTMP kinase n=1 Tax=Buchnera aphidicola TaxID=9 RepID=UPI0031B6E940
MIKSKFIVVEGIEGSGKTEACKIIYDYLYKYGITNTIIVREPGGTIISEKIRKLIISNYNDESLNKETELLLIYAARVQLVKKIIQPALKKGLIVIGDRHHLSSLAYQGGGLGINKKKIYSLKKMFIKTLNPHLTIYLDVDPKVGLSRVNQRGIKDRIENKSIKFFTKVRNTYLKLIKNCPTIITVNTMQKKNLVRNNLELIIKKWISL